MCIYAMDALYIGDFKFMVTFSDNTVREVDIKKVSDIDKRYSTFESFKVLEDESFVKNMKIEGPTLSYKNIDIAPEILHTISKLN